MEIRGSQILCERGTVCRVRYRVYYEHLRFRSMERRMNACMRTCIIHGMRHMRPHSKQKQIAIRFRV